MAAWPWEYGEGKCWKKTAIVRYSALPGIRTHTSSRKQTEKPTVAPFCKKEAMNFNYAWSGGHFRKSAPFPRRTATPPAPFEPLASSIKEWSNVTHRRKVTFCIRIDISASISDLFSILSCDFFKMWTQPCICLSASICPPLALIGTG